MSVLRDINKLKHLTNSVKILKALANERRLAILIFLSKNETKKLGWCVADIARELKIPYKAASKHLILLEQNKLVDRLRVGFEVEYMTSDSGKYLLKHILK